MKARLFLYVFAFLFVACSADRKRIFQPKAKPVNIILLIGDGMGLSQVSASYYFGKEEPNFSRFKNIGLINTSCTNTKITDSAAGATAFSTGQRTFKGALGVSPVDTSAIENITEILSAKGYRTGLVATYSVTHATSAAFYAHIESREDQEQIAKQFIHSEIDFFATPGLPYFNQRKDKLDLTEELESKGFILDTTGLKQMDFSLEKRYGFLMPPVSMPKKMDGRGDFLPRATQMALDYLAKNKDGFFLMVEGAQIDEGGHENNADMIIQEILDFDKAIGIAMDFAEKEGNTLVVVTADHETGGFTLGCLNGDQKDYSTHDNNIIAPSFSIFGHSATLVPVYAYGPGEELFRGTYNNNEIFHKIMKGAKVKK